MKHETIPLAAVDAKCMCTALTQVARVIERRNSIAVLECARLTADSSALRLTATDLDMEVEVSVEAATSGSLDVLVRPGPLLMFLSGVRAEVEITLTDDILEIRAGDRRMRVRLVIPVADWPTFHFEPGEAALTLGEGELRKTLQAAMIAVSSEETRYYLNGIHIRPLEVGSLFEATDGHRLVQYRLPAADWPFPDVILPKKSARVVIGHCERFGNRDVRIAAHPLAQGIRALEFAGQGWRLRTKVIDGTFPDTARVIPALVDDPPVRFAISAETLRGMRRSFGSSAGVDFYPDDGIAVYLDRSADIEITAPISGRGGPVSFNPNYLREFCGTFGPLRLEADGSGGPARLIAEDPEVTLVVMPMRTDNERLKAGRAA